MGDTTLWLWLGFGGQALFFGRFLVQWIASERRGESVVPTAFWFFSVGGGLILLAYAIHRRDPVFIAGQSMGLLIYGRNLWLIFRRGRREEAAAGVAPAPGLAARRHRRDLALVALGMALLVLPALGARDLWNPDEARYAEVAREMIEGGDFLVPHLNGRIYAEKPPLLFWSIAAASAPWGRVTELSARVPSALAAIAAAVAVFLLAGRFFGRRAAWLAAAVFATCLKTLWQGRFGQIDMLLCALVAWSLWWWVRAFTERRPRLYALFFLFAGLATLAKGPVGLLPALLATVAFLLTTGRRGELREMRLGRGLLLWAAVVGAWLVPAAIAGGGEYAETLLFRQNLTRYAAPWGHLQPWYYFLTVVPADFLPWSLLLPTALVVGWRAWGWRRGESTAGAGAGGAGGAAERGGAEDGFRLALAWVVVTLVFFSLSPGKRSVYVFQMYPALALLVGAALDRLGGEWAAAQPRRSPATAWLSLPFGLAAALCAAAAAALPFAWARRPESAWLGEGFRWSLQAALVALALGAAFAVAAAARRRPAAATAALAAGMALVSLVAAIRLLPAFDVFKSPRALAAAFVAHTPAGTPFGVSPHLDNTVLFYTRRPAVPIESPEALRTYLGRPGQAWLFVNRHDLDWLRVAELPLAVVASEPPVEREGYVLLAEVASGNGRRPVRHAAR